MPIASLQKLLGHKHLSTTQIYAHIYDETLYKQFSAAMSDLEAIAVEDWPQRVLAQPTIEAQGNTTNEVKIPPK